MKKKILVTGANGYIGNALVLALLHRRNEFRVAAAARRGSVLKSKALDVYVSGNLEDNPEYGAMLNDCDVIVHCAAMIPNSRHWPLDFSSLQRANVLGATHLARQAVMAGVKRFVFLSTIEVNGEVTPEGKKFFPDSLPRPKNSMGLVMLKTETELKNIAEETGLEVVIVRVPTVYGPDCKNLFYAMQMMVKYCLPLPLRSTGRNERSMVGIDNLCDFLICASTHPKAADETFMVSDGNDLSTLQIFKLLAKTGKRPCLLWPFPTALLKLFNSYIGRRAWGDFFFESAVVDITKNRLLLGWVPPISVEESIARTWLPRLVIGENTD